MNTRPLTGLIAALGFAFAVSAVPAALQASGSIAASAIASPAARPPAVQCSRFAAPGGNDGSRGTKARPFRTTQRLADSLRAGQTGCLRGGTYNDSEDGYVLRVDRGGTRGRPVTIRSFPGERARLVGVVSVMRGADYVTLAALGIEGLGEQNTVKIYAADTVVQDSDISNASRGESCMILGSTSGHGEAVRPTVRRNRFHDCGSTEHDNKDHAIYVSNASDGQITGNVFWRTAGYSIHLYPNARRTRIAHNVIDGGAPSIRGGVLFGGNSDYASSENVIEFNVIAYADTYNITSNWDEGLIGNGNLARANCVWQGKEGNIDASDGGFTAHSNRVAPPLFVSRERRDYRLKRGSRCRRVVGYDAAARLRSRS
jgi:hypothetical protein